MHPEHTKIIAAIKKHKGNGNQHSKNDRYLLSGHTYYDVPVPLRRKIAKAWLRENKEIADYKFVAFLESLIKGASHEEKTIACYLLSYHDKGRAAVTIRDLDGWLDYLVGWAEIDAFCANIFTKDEVLKNWKAWETFIKKLRKDININKRRAALVYLVGPGHYSNDVRIRTLAFETIDTLKSEKEILITKAISWLLREMVASNKKEVSEYLKKNKDSLPKIAFRETIRKILTGRKS